MNNGKWDHHRDLTEVQASFMWLFEKWWMWTYVWHGNTHQNIFLEFHSCWSADGFINYEHDTLSHPSLVN